jgi:serine acetyltransferase
VVEVFWAVSPGNLDAAGHDQVDITALSPATRNARVVGAVGAPALRRYLVAAWPADRFATVVSLAAYVDPSCTIGAGTVIVPGAVLTVDVVVGEHCRVNIGETLSHDVHLASFVTIGPGTVLADLMTLSAVVAGVPASVMKVRDGWLDAL